MNRNLSNLVGKAADWARQKADKEEADKARLLARREFEERLAKVTTRSYSEFEVHLKRRAPSISVSSSSDASFGSSTVVFELPDSPEKRKKGCLSFLPSCMKK